VDDKKDEKDPSGLTCDDYGAVEVKRPHVFGCCNKCGVACARLHWFILSCIINAFLAPIILTFHALRLYCCPCVVAYLEKCLGHTFRAVCCECCWRFTDSDFPPNSDSIGKTSKQFAPGTRDSSCCCPSLVEEGGDVWWRRTEELFAEAKDADGKEKGKHAAKLFSGGITPSDIAQGALGDCWLLAAIATLAEHEGVIESCFVSTNYSPLGKYEVKLWDPAKNEKTTFSVDDTIPCNKSGTPLFTTPNGEELWVFLLEKAFAKTMGDYASLEGGLPAWAMYLMTGDDTLHWSNDNGSWSACELKAKDNGTSTSGKPLHRASYYPTGEKINGPALFTLICEYVDQGCALGAGTKGKDETINNGRGSGGGIVPGHAYSILDCRKVFEFEMIKLRNPWGTFEWNGDWSDSSEKWNQHPAVKADLITADKNKTDGEGTFWMSFADFLMYFDMVDVTVLTQGMRQLQFNSNEDIGICGPCVGCLEGCCCFFVGCKGCCKLYCDRKSNKVFALDSVNAGGSENQSGSGASYGFCPMSAPMAVDSVRPPSGIQQEAPNPFAASESEFCDQIMKMADAQGVICLEDWMDAAWKNGCDTSEMPRMVQLFIQVLADPGQHDQASAETVRRVFHRPTAEV